MTLDDYVKEHTRQVVEHCWGILHAACTPPLPLSRAADTLPSPTPSQRSIMTPLPFPEIYSDPTDDDLAALDAALQDEGDPDFEEVDQVPQLYQALTLLETTLRLLGEVLEQGALEQDLSDDLLALQQDVEIFLEED